MMMVMIEGSTLERTDSQYRQPDTRGMNDRGEYYDVCHPVVWLADH